MTPKVFVDMDGVLADFTTAFGNFIGQKIKSYIRITGSEWGKLQREWPTFWMDLDYMPHALDLWRVTSKYNASLLTAIPPSWPSAAVGKRIWAKRMLPKFGYHPQQDFIACLRHEKQRYAQQPDETPNVLIDDHRPNIDEWTAAGGVAIHYIPSSGMVGRVDTILKQHIHSFVRV